MIEKRLLLPDGVTIETENLDFETENLDFETDDDLSDFDYGPDSWE